MAKLKTVPRPTSIKSGRIRIKEQEIRINLDSNGHELVKRVRLRTHPFPLAATRRLPTSAAGRLPCNPDTRTWTHPLHYEVTAAGRLPCSLDTRTRTHPLQYRDDWNQRNTRRAKQWDCWELKISSLHKIVTNVTPVVQSNETKDFFRYIKSYIKKNQKPNKINSNECDWIAIKCLSNQLNVY